MINRIVNKSFFAIIVIAYEVYMEDSIVLNSLYRWHFVSEISTLTKHIIFCITLKIGNASSSW